MKETELSAKLMAYLNKRADTDAIRIENIAADCALDINYAIQRAQGWIETKIAKSQWLYFERFQLPAMRKRARVLGGRGVWVVAEVNGAVHMWRATAVFTAKREAYEKWTRIHFTWLPIANYSTSFERPDWQGLVDTILADER